MKRKFFTVVIKLGTSSLVDEVTHEHKIANMSLIVEMAVKLRREGHHVIIVSSGSVGVGLKQLDLASRPKKLSMVQAVAAVGQARLIGLWEDLFGQLEQPIAQILLTRNDVADRTQYLNAANTMHELINMGIIPIVNENDTLSVHEIKFGDNDTLSAITAGMVSADYLFLMTDVDCLYTENPRSNPDAKPILVVDDVHQLKVDVTSGGSDVGTGGMTTKLIAAELASSAGVTTIICRSSVPGNVHSIVNHIQDVQLKKSPELDAEKVDEYIENLNLNDVPLHTKFSPQEHPIRDRQFWILHTLAAHGSIVVDEGAYQAITRSDRAGLLPVGILEVNGTFHNSECVELYVAKRNRKGGVDRSNGEEPLLIGRAIVNYSSPEIDRIRGKQSSDIEKELGYADSEYVAFRDNMAFVAGRRVTETDINLLDTEYVRKIRRGSRGSDRSSRSSRSEGSDKERKGSDSDNVHVAANNGVAVETAS
uniref:ARAD1D35420p n=1 Tax=Blastobotrys adeninivorans TaxID=409370 RepID=A0A060TH21_BLAAD